MPIIFPIIGSRYENMVRIRTILKLFFEKNYLTSEVTATLFLAQIASPVPKNKGLSLP